MIVKWNVECVGEVSFDLPDARLVRFVHALQLLGFSPTVEMSN